MRLLSSVKNLAVPEGRKPRTVLAGPFRGINFDLSLRSDLQLYLGLFERETYPWLLRLSEGIATAVDAGMAFGEYTLFFLKRTKASMVYAFEPDPEPRSVFSRNLDLNASVDPCRLRISYKRVGSQDNETEASLDGMAGAIEYPCLIKMDIEGGEVTALRGAAQINARHGIRWLIETHAKSLEDECVRILSESGFQTHIIAPAWWRAAVPELRPVEHNRWLAAWK